MNEKDYRMDEELTRFEKDLKSLTPRHCSAAASVPTMPAFHDNRLTSRVDTGVGIDHQSSSLSFTNGRWLKTVAVSWATGLAAGLLISAIWTSLMKEETYITEPSLVTENGSTATVSEPVKTLEISQNPLLITLPRQHATLPLAGQEFGRNRRSPLLDSRDAQILSPFMAFNSVNWNGTTSSSAKRLTGIPTGTNQRLEQSIAPNQNSDASQESLPFSFPKSQGQRQLLKSLMESDDLISI